MAMLLLTVSSFAPGLERSIVSILATSAARAARRVPQGPTLRTSWGNHVVRHFRLATSVAPAAADPDQARSRP
jgi:hypothetical protein